MASSMSGPVWVPASYTPRADGHPADVSVAWSSLACERAATASSVPCKNAMRGRSPAGAEGSAAGDSASSRLLRDGHAAAPSLPGGEARRALAASSCSSAPQPAPPAGNWGSFAPLAVSETEGGRRFGGAEVPAAALLPGRGDDAGEATTSAYRGASSWSPSAPACCSAWPACRGWSASLLAASCSSKSCAAHSGECCVRAASDALPKMPATMEGVMPRRRNGASAEGMWYTPESAMTAAGSCGPDAAPPSTAPASWFVAEGAATDARAAAELNV
mmetsp:Transcript_23500/g.89300  ORF Transcript_23500/g.89300 Transcript_23500/m.89300 type:complete len:275 (+) Transcript_23500:588-1412(+)